MRKIIIHSMITLDGVIQGPGGPEEDTSNGFEFGGWVAPYTDDVFRNAVQEELKPSDYLLGRKTFEIWAGYWPQHGDFWPGINEGTKFVFSKKLKNTDPLVADWNNSEVVSSVEDIRRIKNESPKNPHSKNGDIQVWGSGELIQFLLQNDLADEMRIKIFPLTLGKGKKLFSSGTIPAAFKLVDTVVTPSGVIIAHYRRAGKVETGQVSASK